MLEFVRNGKTIMMEHDDGQFEIVSEEAKEEYAKAKAKMEEEERLLLEKTEQK